jgi:hypothetical protein
MVALNPRLGSWVFSLQGIRSLRVQSGGMFPLGLGRAFNREGREGGREGREDGREGREGGREGREDGREGREDGREERGRRARGLVFSCAKSSGLRKVPVCGNVLFKFVKGISLGGDSLLAWR